MRLSRYLIATQKENPADATVTSHRLMIRAGLIRKEAAGMYAYLPLGYRALRKVMEIIREEMDRAGALEFLMPEMTVGDLWKESGRWVSMGPEMFRVTDRNGMEYALAPTHEESFAGMIRNLVSSYRDLPLNAYQMNTKFRDEIRPRFGVIRSKEFIMKDAYSFDIDAESLENSYQKMRQAYRRIFERCGLETIPVEADTGSMGGSDSEEFMVASEIGEEVLCICPSCGYRANQEKAEYGRNEPAKEEPLPVEEVETPAVSTIDDLSEFFDASPSRFMKSLIYMADGKPVMAVLTGDRELNETKLKNALGVLECELADDRTIEDITGAPTGFAGPVLDSEIKIFCDLSVRFMTNGITGANKKDYHLKNVNPGRDFPIQYEGDISSAEKGDPCPKCGTGLDLTRGIEVGHIFKLGDKYTKSMGMTVLDEQGKEVTPIMGCYGIGVNRTLAAIVEQHNDERGIIWPESVSPYQVHLVGIAKSEEEWKRIDSVYDELVKAGLNVLYDDRQVSPGIKFADADLMGVPWRVTAGKTFFSEDKVEIKARREKDFTAVSAPLLVEELDRLFRREQGKL